MNSTPHPGAPQGNTNALKHGFYSRSFRAAEQTGLAEFDPASLQNEIELMRVFILRTAELGEQVATLAESMTLLNVLSRAAISLGVLIRTQQALTLRKESADLADLSSQLNAASRRAAALLKRLPPQPLDPPPPASNQAEVSPSACIPSPSGRGQGEGSSLSSPHASCSRRGDGSGQGEGSSLSSPHASCSTKGDGSGQGEGPSLPQSQPAPEPTYSLGPENCLPSSQCFTCPDRTLCPDCQTYLHTHTPPPTLSVEQAITDHPGAKTGLSFPLSRFYAIESQFPNCSELFPPNNSPSQPQVST